MVTGNLRRFESVRRLAPGAFSRNPEAFMPKDLGSPLELEKALGGKFPAAIVSFWLKLFGWFLPG